MGIIQALATVHLRQHRHRRSQDFRLRGAKPQITCNDFIGNFLKEGLLMGQRYLTVKCVGLGCLEGSNPFQRICLHSEFLSFWYIIMISIMRLVIIVYANNNAISLLATSMNYISAGLDYMQLSQAKV